MIVPRSAVADLHQDLGFLHPAQLEAQIGPGGEMLSDGEVAARPRRLSKTALLHESWQHSGCSDSYTHVLHVYRFISAAAYTCLGVALAVFLAWCGVARAHTTTKTFIDHFGAPDTPHHVVGFIRKSTKR